jgi:hypothetical protein
LAAGETKKLMNPAPATSLLVDQGRIRQLRDQQLRQLPRVALQRSRQLHGQVTGEITVRGLLRSLDVYRAVGLGWRHTEQCGTHQFGKVELEIWTHRDVSAGEWGQAVDYTMPDHRSGERCGAMKGVSV